MAKNISLISESASCPLAVTIAVVNLTLKDYSKKIIVKYSLMTDFVTEKYY
jgi:hypothetical protein